MEIFKDFMEILLVTVVICLVLFIFTGTIAYDDEAHDRAICWAKEVQSSHIGGTTNVHQVIPGVYKVEHQNGLIEQKLSGNIEDDSEFYLSTFVDLEVNDIKEIFK